MYFTGFADEAGSSIDTQINATKELGWNYIESRSVNNTNITDLSDADFEIVFNKLLEADIKISCFGSAIANWAKDPRSQEDFLYSLAALKRAIPRMNRLGTKYLRGMSFGIVKDVEPDHPEIEKQIFEKLKILVKHCEDAGIIYLHENCMNYGGLSYEHTLRLVDAIPSPNFRLVFDTGNPVGSDHHVGTPPYKKQSSWEFYKNVRDFIEYIHIKDCIFIEETGEIFPKLTFTFPGDGHGDVIRILKDLIDSGYNGGLSIEPHLAVVYHDGSKKSSQEIQYENYVNYGKRLMDIVNELNTVNS